MSWKRLLLNIRKVLNPEYEVQHWRKFNWSKISGYEPWKYSATEVFPFSPSKVVCIAFCRLSPITYIKIWIQVFDVKKYQITLYRRTTPFPRWVGSILRPLRAFSNFIISRRSMFGRMSRRRRMSHMKSMTGCSLWKAVLATSKLRSGFHIWEWRIDWW